MGNQWAGELAGDRVTQLDPRSLIAIGQASTLLSQFCWYFPFPFVVGSCLLAVDV